MYSGNTKKYYRETVRHVFMKSADRRKTLNFFPLSCFSSYFTFLPLGDASLCSEKIAATVKIANVFWNITRVSLWSLCNVHFVQSQRPCIRPTIAN
jgi:hypothetical protein